MFVALLLSFILRASVCLFFTPAAAPHSYTLSLHDALPISPRSRPAGAGPDRAAPRRAGTPPPPPPPPGRHGPSDRKSTRLNSSHRCISYAVFCLKKKKKKYT